MKKLRLLVFWNQNVLTVPTIGIIPSYPIERVDVSVVAVGVRTLPPRK